MVKTTSKSKAKTKTTKAAKTTKKTVSVKVTKKVTTVSKVNLNGVNLISVLAFVGLAALASYLMNSASYQVTINYLTSDAVNQAISPAYRHFKDIELRWLLVGTLLLSALVPLLHLTKRKVAYKNYLSYKVVPWRWVEQGVLGALVVSIVALLVGFQDLVTLKLFATTLLGISFLGWCAEREFVTNKAAAVKFQLIGAISSVLVALFLGSSLLATFVYGQVRASWYVYAAFATLVVTLLLNGLNQHRQFGGSANSKNYEVVERNYLVIGLVSKVALAAILIAGLAK